jgi:haloacid dehalogenase-like hydrolase
VAPKSGVRIPEVVPEHETKDLRLLTIAGEISTMAVHLLPKQETRVRFPHLAPRKLHKMNDNFIFYVDFDSTLYNTGRFAAELFSVISKESGVSRENVASDSKQFFSHPGLGGYDYAAHVESLGLDPEVMWRKLSELVKANNYLYPDSVPFMQAARNKGYEPKILSFGEQRFQMIKIQSVLTMLADSNGINPEVSVVNRKKHEHIRALHPGQKGLLIDDVSDQELPPGFTEIHLNRNLELANPIQKAGGFTVCNLHQALQAIRQ